MPITRLLTFLLIAPLSSFNSGAAEIEESSANIERVQQQTPGATPAPAVVHPRYQAAPLTSPYKPNASPAHDRAAPKQTPGLPVNPRRAEPVGPQSAVPRWLEEVRAQRRALREKRRAAHKARIDALDPIGSAKRDEREDLRRRLQEERREQIESERRLYLNRGPWLSPLAPRPPLPAGLDPLARGSLDPQDALQDPPPRPEGDPMTPSDWDNLWYYNGW
jgi:hypothetical protein